MSAEFVGNPELNPERTFQSDLWIEGTYPGFSVSVDAFLRRVDQYITLIPTNLPKRLPSSPNTVYAYRNGTANFHGFEVTTALQILPGLRWDEGLSYLWGQDLTQHEPAIGISPFRTDSRLRYNWARKGLYAEVNLHTASTQNRVAASRGEATTPGYYTIGLHGGLDVTSSI